MILIGIIVVALLALNQFTSPRSAFLFPGEFCASGSSCSPNGVDPKYEKVGFWSYLPSSGVGIGDARAKANIFISKQIADSYSCIDRESIPDNQGDQLGFTVYQLIVLCECSLGQGNCPPPPPPPPNECTDIGTSCVNNELLSCVDTSIPTGSYLKEIVEATCTVDQICDVSSESCLDIPEDEVIDEVTDEVTDEATDEITDEVTDEITDEVIDSTVTDTSKAEEESDLTPEEEENKNNLIIAAIIIGIGIILVVIIRRK